MATIHPRTYRKKSLGNAKQPSLSPEEANSPTMNYEEEQQQEIEALQSIFPPDDFELTVQPTAWSRTNERKVKLRIRSVLDDSQYIMLCAQLSATYPRSPPSLAIEGGESFHERTRNRIQTTIQKRPKQLLGSQMLWDISDEIREALDDAVSARRKGTLPSLDVERASAEEMASSLAKQAEEAEEQRLLKEKEEEAVAIQQMISQQMVKQEKRKSLRPTIQSPKQSRQHPAPEVISFGQSARIKVGNDTETFTAVTINGLISNTELEGTYLGTPLVSNSENRPPIVAIKRRTMKKPKEEIIALESILTRVQRLEHPHLLNVLAYRINQLEDSKSELVLCREHCNRGHLADQLSLGSLHTTKARQFTTELLEGLDYLHRHGIIHGFINTRSVYLATNPDLAAKLSGFGYAKALGLVDSSRPAKWNAPQTNSSASHTVQVQSDIWDLGVVAVQMFLGPEALEEHASPFDLIDRPDISDAFRNFLSKIFLRKEHISCFDLLPAELLRTNLPVLQPVSTRNRHQAKSSGSGFSDRGRYDSSTNFTQISRLGKGGFGEVVKARHKIDQSLYAIKKIKAQSGPLLDKLIAEAMLLGRLNHPYVVRYINTWIEAEELGSASTMDGNLSESEVHSDSECVSSSFNDYQLTSYEDDQSLDSKDDVFERDGSGESQDLDSDDDLFERDDQTSASSGELQATAAARRRTTRSDSSGRPTVLYIQMELCDGRSLSDAIRKGMGEEDAWMMLRRITEGLAHVHSHGIIHRDLKPDNIFIDSMGNPKIGDFGLATTGHYKIADRTGGSKGSASLEMTQGVGTALYVAPEIQSPSGRTYNEKVDMYSLGIIFFEMCQRFSTAMERIMELKQIRQRDHKLPGAFLSDGEKAAQGVLINCLISHDPSERPSSAELLRDSRMPANLEDQTIQEALRALSDESSPYHHRMLSALFAPSSEHMQRAKDIAWDAGSSTTSGEPLRVRLRSICQSVLEAIFRKHGGEEDRRDFIFPRSGYYASEKVMQVIDTSGNLLQLPYDQKLPYARQLARRPAATRCTFVFGGAYRNRAEGPPKVTFEADFDIVNDEQEEEPAANDAEVLKVLDESLTELPQFVANSACFHLSHGLLIDAILDHCRVPQHLQNKVKDIIERVPFDLKWPDARHQLRNAGLSDTTLDDLWKFHGYDLLPKASTRLQEQFIGAKPRVKAKVDEALNEIRKIIELAQQYGVCRTMFIAPLSCFKPRFYATGVMFQCIVEKGKHGIVIAAGGRYDSLIRAHQASSDRATKQGAVGVVIAVDAIVNQLMPKSGADRYLKDPVQIQHLPRRVDCQVVTSGTENARVAGIKLVTSLWAANISAELGQDHRASQQQDALFVAHLRHETSTTVRLTKTGSETEDVDVPITGLIAHIQQEIRDRSNSKTRVPPLLRSHSSQHESGERKPKNVEILKAQHRSRKTNNFDIVESAQKNWEEKLDQMKETRILAVEVRDGALELLQETRLSDAESWKRAVHSVQANERQYLEQVRDILFSWRSDWSQGEGAREVCVHNFLTRDCIYYDLGA